MEKFVPENKSHSLTRSDDEVGERGFSSAEVVVQVDQNSESAFFAIFAAKRSVSVSRELLSRFIAIETESFIERNGLSAPDKGRKVMAYP